MMKDYLNIRETIIDGANKDPKIAETSREILDIFVGGTKEGLSRGSKDLSIFDIYQIPNEITDENLDFLHGFLGGSREYVNIDPDGKKYITEKGYARLNYILDMASKHARRYGLGMSYFRRNFGENGLNIMQTQKMESGKEKIYFNVNNVGQYKGLLKLLTAPHDTKNPGLDHNEKIKNLIMNDKNGFFAKNIVAMGHIQNNECYIQKRKLFQYSLTEIFGKFFNHKFDDIQIETGLSGGDHGHNIQKKLEFDINGKKTTITLVGNVKTESSTVNKVMRVPTAEADNDMIRYQIVAKNDRQLIDVLYHFIAFFYNDFYHVFNHKKELELINKGGINTAYASTNEQINNLPDGKIKDMIKNVKTVRKGSSAGGYTDIKLRIPVNMKGVLFPIELKFVTETDENNIGFSSHAMLKGAEKIERLSRWKKGLTSDEIMSIACEIAASNPELEDQLVRGHPQDLQDELYDYFVRNKCSTINIDGIGEPLYCAKDLKENMESKGFWPK